MKKTKSGIEEGSRNEYRLNIDVLFTQWGNNLSLDSFKAGRGGKSAVFVGVSKWWINYFLCVLAMDEPQPRQSIILDSQLAMQYWVTSFYV